MPTTSAARGPNAEEGRPDRSGEKERAMNPTNGVSHLTALNLRRLVAFAAALFLATTMMLGVAQAESRYPPLAEYLLPQDEEIALAKSAAPANISDHATIKLLTASGYEVASEG